MSTTPLVIRKTTKRTLSQRAYVGGQFKWECFLITRPDWRFFVRGAPLTPLVSMLGRIRGPPAASRWQYLNIESRGEGNGGVADYIEKRVFYSRNLTHQRV